MTVCVYALVAGSARVSGRGAGGERLRLVREASVGAVIGQLSKVPAASPAQLRRYDRTIRALAVTQAAVLPARFGTCVDDLDELRFILRSRRLALQRALRHVRGRSQMTVRLLGEADADAALRARVAGNPRSGKDVSPQVLARPRVAPRLDGEGPSAAGPGTQFLRGRADAAARARQVRGFEPMQGAVRRWIRDERVERRAGVTTVYHLIPRASADGYCRAIERAALEAGCRLLVTGPWPPYAFVEGW